MCGISTCYVHIPHMLCAVYTIVLCFWQTVAYRNIQSCYTMQTVGNYIVNKPMPDICILAPPVAYTTIRKGNVVILNIWFEHFLESLENLASWKFATATTIWVWLHKIGSTQIQRMNYIRKWEKKKKKNIIINHGNLVAVHKKQFSRWRMLSDC